MPSRQKEDVHSSPLVSPNLNVLRIGVFNLTNAHNVSERNASFKSELRHGFAELTPILLRCSVRVDSDVNVLFRIPSMKDRTKKSNVVTNIANHELQRADERERILEGPLTIEFGLSHT